MKISCYICGDEVEVRAAKTGAAHWLCPGCGVRCFVNNPEGIAGLEALAIDGGRFEGKPKAEPPGPTPGVNAKQVADAVKGEIMPMLKTMDKEIKELKAQVAEPKAPPKKKAPPRKERETAADYLFS